MEVKPIQSGGVDGLSGVGGIRQVVLFLYQLQNGVKNLRNSIKIKSRSCSVSNAATTA
ncbi:hypothetical protein HIX57_001520 [Salmonella enterica]|nr:hypothetical protein [Salmonella enterica]HCJ1778873.1 hypothetical protein [Salmonella enterica]